MLVVVAYAWGSSGEEDIVVVGKPWLAERGVNWSGREDSTSRYDYSKAGALERGMEEVDEVVFLKLECWATGGGSYAAMFVCDNSDVFCVKVRGLSREKRATLWGTKSLKTPDLLDTRATSTVTHTFPSQ